ncbi:peptidoglycan-binding protein [Bartonella sp. HY329]|uniref:peptidoglycan-binding domain-containing protein n=1 Tax=unclassified Bartonella TaxID=2645622 RepID=UPI0021C97248|nr:MULTISPECIES: peptidoglycan-binding domain-containing protein [unclassified Bartonella]UXM94176.1 peptidoglycan-binding protein [Bartonella sp. HY329]UXN08498.1 peptidoglycan-binding protein [Bartonella sp. HY328]
MAKAKTKSTKRRKTKKKSQQRITNVISSRVALLLKWLIYSAGKTIKNNPLLSFGFFLFLCLTLFLAFSSFFNQNMIARSFFFTSHIEKNPTTTANSLTIESLLSEETNSQQAQNHNSIPALENQIVPSPRPQPSQNSAIPRQQTPSLMGVPQVKPKPLTTNNLPTTILSKEKAQIMRVQTALRNFGNIDLIVNGVIDTPTKKAIIAFQKKFMMNETGIINRQLLNKLRELGLLENDTNGLY